MMLKVCSCGKAIPMNRSQCSSCKDKRKERHKQYDEHKRDETTSKFYKSNKWRKLRNARNAKDNGLCQRCLRDGKIKKADICHHIVEVKDDWSRRLDINNLEMVCSGCHNKIHSNN